MRFARIDVAGRNALARVDEQGGLRAVFDDEPGAPGALDDVVAGGHAALAAAYAQLARGREVDPAAVRYLPPLGRGKIICVGLNYADHSKESGYELPAYPTLFARWASSLIGHRAPIVRPLASVELDFEGELVAVIGKRGRAIEEARALDHVVGYSIFNDASIRDFQRKTPQWTIGKNFDATGGFGPHLVTADELPPGARGLVLETKLNGESVQRASTDDMVFGVARLVAILSAAMTLEAGDLLVTGTPSGVGMGRKPPLWMKAGDVCTVSVERIGTLENRIVDQAADA
jgi:2-keto-4-pentenoate hydratase/2-oxohepta-3-ene-1,7-dioic acid hydratase in catechol pathway